MSDVPRPPPAGMVAAAFEALRFNPIVIGVLLLNVLYVVAASWYLMRTEDHHAEAIKLLIEHCPRT